MQTSENKINPRVHTGLVDESWESLAQMTLQFETTMINNNGARNVSKRLQYIKHVLHFYLKDAKGIEIFSSTLMIVKFARTVHRIERHLVRNKIPPTPFLIFLKTIVEKAKKEKIKAEKPLERITEFGKLKNYAENGNSKFDV